MKFNSLLDVNTFLAEIRDYDAIGNVDETFKPTNEQLQSFLKARTPLVKKLKDYKKSSNTKSSWKENRYKMMKGIKAFHKSVEGKRFHKRLGRFIATRITRGGEKKDEENYQTLMSKQGHLKGLNAAKQHLFVELEYFHQLDEHVEVEEFIMDYAIPLFQRIEEKIIKDTSLSDNELTFLYDITENNAVLKSLAEKTGKEFATIEKLWNSIATDLTKNEGKESDAEFFPMLVDILKKKLGIK